MLLDDPVGGLELGGLVLDFCFAAYLSWLRLRLSEQTSTWTQRLAVSLLAWLFWINAVVYLVGFKLGGVDPRVLQVVNDLDLLTPTIVLGFALVFPRLRYPPSRTVVLLSGVALMGAVELVVQLVIHGQAARGVLSASDAEAALTALNITAYAVGWFVPLFLWLPQYGRERNSSTRLVLAAASWGFLSLPLQLRLYEIPRWQSHSSGVVEGLRVVEVVLLLAALALLVMGLNRNRNRWSLPEWVHLGMLVTLPALTIVLAAAVDGGARTLTHLQQWLLLVMPWTVLRPLLLCLTLLKFQATAPDLPVERDLSLLGALIGGVTVGGIVVGTIGFGPLGIVAGLLVGVLMLYPAFRLVRRVTRVVMGVRWVNARETYQLLLQTAVVAGRIPHRADEASLRTLRAGMGLTEQAHAQLLAQLQEATPMAVGQSEITDLFVLHADGRLIAHVGAAARSTAEQHDLDLVVDDLRLQLQTLDPDYASTGTMRAGHPSLLVHRQGTLALGAVVEGPDPASMTQVLEEWAELLESTYRESLAAWDGTPQPLDSLVAELRRTFTWSKALLT